MQHRPMTANNWPIATHNGQQRHHDAAVATRTGAIQTRRSEPGMQIPVGRAGLILKAD